MDALINDVLRHANEAGLFARPPARRKTVTGEVIGFVAGGALIDAGGALPVTVRSELTAPGIPLDWLLEKGSQVGGELDLDSRRLNLTELPWTAEALLEHFPHGTVTLGLVEQAEPERAIVRMHPRVAVPLSVRDVTSNPHDRLDLLLVAGEVVPVRVIHLSDGTMHLRLSDIDDDEPIASPVALVEGGLPWLAEGRSLLPDGRQIELEPTAEPAPEPAPTPRPGPGPRPAVPGSAPAPEAASAQHPRTALQVAQLAVQQLKAENAQLHAELQEVSRRGRLQEQLANATRRARDAQAELGEALARIRELEERHRNSARLLREARRTSVAPVVDTPRERRERWPDAESWLRHEIQLAWVGRVPSYEKTRFPLPEYRVGERFTDSIEALDAGQFDKAMKSVVDALTGRDRELDGRDLHTLRSAINGDAAPRTRGDGMICWRAAIERNSPSARRLHYWAGNGNPIELSRVVLHDDMEP